MTDKEIVKEISEELFDLFVMNTQVFARQMPDGNYIPKRIKYDKRLFEAMLIRESSLGVYQQQYKRNVMKWICIDFDCKEKTADIEILAKLVKKYVIPCTKNLDAKGIKYLTEFSGRRGVHVWILFDTIISKQQGYILINKLFEPIKDKINSDDEYGVDLFPATGSGKNKYGKLVKLPLSTHKSGGRSYFIKDLLDFERCFENGNSKFSWDEQLSILQNYKKNNYSQVSENLNLSKICISFKTPTYKKEYVLGDKHISFEEIEKKCKGSQLLSKIFKRVHYGQLNYFDRIVLVGIFSHFNDDKLLHELFSLQENYNESITQKNIDKHRKQYYPITMKYLHDLYHEDMQETISPSISALEYICNAIGIDRSKIHGYTKHDDEAENEYEKIHDLIKKELNYMEYNDEVVNILDLFTLKNFKKYDCQKLWGKATQIINGTIPDITIEYKTYKRYELDKENPRILVSLSPKDRLLTTLLIYEFVGKLNWRFNSYSYNVNLLPDGDIFFPWYNSWRNFNQEIRSYLTIDILDDFSLIKIDIRKFYDSIYLHAVYKQMETILYEKSIPSDLLKIKNILTYLSIYNETLMKDLTGEIKGVPQGPAYARILAELFISTILQEFQNKNERLDISLFRYVDDIYILYKAPVDGINLLNELKKILLSKGLEVNESKSKILGKISEINEKDKSELINTGLANYQIKSVKNLELESDEELDVKLQLLESYMKKNESWLKDGNFILNNYIDNKYINVYLEKYYKPILESKIGRGSIFFRFYTFVLTNKEWRNKFFTETSYKLIPSKSISLKNCLNILFQELDKGLLDEYFVETKKMLDYFKEYVHEYDEDENILISSIDRYIKRIHNYE